MSSAARLQRRRKTAPDELSTRFCSGAMANSAVRFDPATPSTGSTIRWRKAWRCASVAEGSFGISHIRAVRDDRGRLSARQIAAGRCAIAAAVRNLFGEHEGRVRLQGHRQHQDVADCYTASVHGVRRCCCHRHLTSWLFRWRVDSPPSSSSADATRAQAAAERRRFREVDDDGRCMRTDLRRAGALASSLPARRAACPASVARRDCDPQ